MKVGDIVDLVVTKVSGYACWGTTDGKIGFSHCVDWSNGVPLPHWSETKPLPPQWTPAVGDIIKMRVFHLSDLPSTALPADVSFEGTIKVEFACSRVLVDEQRWIRRLEKKKPNQAPEPTAPSGRGSS